jgi:3-deoxy-D-manno-octulosonic-acid transferase
VLLLDVLYVVAFILLSPWILVMTIFRPSFRAGMGARFRPALQAEPARQTIWLHGSSAGEIDREINDRVLRKRVFCRCVP